MSSTQIEDFWSGLDSAAAADFSERSSPYAYARGRILMHARQAPDRVILIRSGRVKVCVPTPSGREVVLAYRGEGELVGELAALDQQPRSATIIALDHVDALVVSHQVFRAFLLDHPAAALWLLQMVSRRLRDSDAKRIEFSTTTTISRVAAQLLELSDRFGRAEEGGVHISLPLTQEELAGSTGASVESVARALHTMRTLKCVETRRRGIRVLDRTALEALRGVI